MLLQQIFELKQKRGQQLVTQEVHAILTLAQEAAQLRLKLFTHEGLFFQDWCENMLNGEQQLVQQLNVCLQNWTQALEK